MEDNQPRNETETTQRTEESDFRRETEEGLHQEEPRENKKRERSEEREDSLTKQRKVEIESNSALPTITIRRAFSPTSDKISPPPFTEESRESRPVSSSSRIEEPERSRDEKRSERRDSREKSRDRRDSRDRSRERRDTREKSSESRTRDYSPRKRDDRRSESPRKRDYSDRRSGSRSERRSRSRSPSRKDDYSFYKKTKSDRDSSPRDKYSSRSKDYSSSSSSRDHYSRDSSRDYPSSSRDDYKSSSSSSKGYPSSSSSSRDTYSRESSSSYIPGVKDDRSPPRDVYQPSRDSYKPPYSSSSGSSTSGYQPSRDSYPPRDPYAPYTAPKDVPTNRDYHAPPRTDYSSSYVPRDNYQAPRDNFATTSTSRGYAPSGGYGTQPSYGGYGGYSNPPASSSSSSSYMPESTPSYSQPYPSSRGGSSYYQGRPNYEEGVIYGQSQGNASSKENFSGLPQFQKKFYVESKLVRERSREEVAKYLKEHQVITEGKDVPNPVLFFSESNLHEDMINEFARQKFAAPTPIQAVAWPAALQGRDIIGIAQTGSGKTLAFALPMIVHIMGQEPLRRGDGPIGLILAPTRELAQQIEEEITKFLRRRLRVASVYGGVPKGGQIRALQHGVEIVIACPGRLIEMIEKGFTNMKRVTFLCLDEADRMLDMGFEPQIRRIVGEIRPDRQTAMFSATWPKAVKQLANDFFNDPKGYIKIKIGSQELKATQTITQIIDVCGEEEKRGKLFNLLKSVYTKDTKILIFCETKSSTDMITRELRNNRFNAYAIHGDKTQSERSWVLREFSDGNVPIMVATDVAARGLDVDNIKLVVNYDFPGTSEDYIHRIGRTGRAGAKGTAYSFFTEKKARLASELISILKDAKQDVPQQLYHMEQQFRSNKGRNKKGGGGGGWKGGNNFHRPGGFNPPGGYGGGGGGYNHW